MPAGDIDREIFGRLMEGPHSLYKSSHDKVRCCPYLISATAISHIAVLSFVLEWQALGFYIAL